MAIFELQVYQAVAGAQPFTAWLENLADPQARARIRTRLDRLALGNFGDYHALDGGVFELRIDWGPGYRVYFARVGKTIVLLLCAGDKRTQTRDIKDAKAYLQDYRRRAKKAGAGSRSV